MKRTILYLVLAGFLLGATGSFAQDSLKVKDKEKKEKKKKDGN